MIWFSKILIKLLLKKKALSVQHSPEKEITLRPEKINRVLVVSCTAIGDTLFALPGIRALRKLLPKATIDLLVRDKVYPIFEDFPVADNFLIYKGHYKNSLSLLRRIKENSYQLCIVFHDSDPCPVELSFLANIEFIFRIGQKDEKTAKYLTKRVPYNHKRHAIDQRLEVLRQVFNVPLDSKDDLIMELPVKKERVKECWDNILKDFPNIKINTPLIGFQFSASGSYKEWPIDKFIVLGNKLIDTNNIVVLLGGAKDKEKARTIIDGIHNKNKIINLCGKIHLSRLPYVVAGLDAIVTNDTGPLHVAIAVKTKSVSLFVSTNVFGTGPIQDLQLHKTIVKPKPCNPCIEKYCKKPNCMNLIEVEEVYEAVNRLLKNQNK